MQVLRDEVGAGAPRLPLAGQEREEIDVRARRKLAPAVAAGRHERERNGVGAGRLRDDRLEQLGDHLVGQRGDGAHDLLPAGPAAMPREDLVAAFGQTRLCPRHRRVVRHVLQHNKAAERSSFRSTARHAKLLFRSRRPRRWISLRWRARRRLAPGRFGGWRIPTFWFPWAAGFFSAKSFPRGVGSASHWSLLVWRCWQNRSRASRNDCDFFFAYLNSYRACHFRGGPAFSEKGNGIRQPQQLSQSEIYMAA